MKHDLSLGLILLAGFGLVSKTARAQAVLQSRDGNSAPCNFSIVNGGILFDKPNQDCNEYHGYKPDSIPTGKTTVTVHKPPLQAWRPPADTRFSKTMHFLVRKEKDCMTAFSLADKGTGSPAEYICENQKDHKPYAELQCDGNQHLQNCYGLRFENGRMVPAVVKVVFSLQ